MLTYTVQTKLRYSALRCKRSTTSQPSNKRAGESQLRSFGPKRSFPKEGHRLCQQVSSPNNVELLPWRKYYLVMLPATMNVSTEKKKISTTTRNNANIRKSFFLKPTCISNYSMPSELSLQKKELKLLNIVPRHNHRNRSPPLPCSSETCSPSTACPSPSRAPEVSRTTPTTCHSCSPRQQTQHTPFFAVKK